MSVSTVYSVVDGEEEWSAIGTSQLRDSRFKLSLLMVALFALYPLTYFIAWGGGMGPPATIATFIFLTLLVKGLLATAIMSTHYNVLLTSRRAFQEIEDSIIQVVAKLVASFRSTASQKSVLLTRSISPDVPEKIVGDRFRIETVIAHLLSNAIKFSPNGSSVQIIVSTSFDDGAAFVVVTVRDFGPGIPSEQQRGLFDSFAPVRPDRLLKGRRSLAISKQTIELHGGKIGLNSAEGHGSEFFFTLPISDYGLQDPATVIHDSHDFSVFARNESDALQGYEQLSTSINSLHNLSATKISADESFKTCLRVMIVDGLVVSSVTLDRLLQFIDANSPTSMPGMKLAEQDRQLFWKAI
eukprot:gene19068-19420_t